MSVLRKHGWFAAAAGITLAYAGVALTVPSSPRLTAFGDIFVLVIMLVAGMILLANALTCPRAERTFWALFAFGFGLWAANQAAWVYREMVLRLPVPDPYFADVILFFHLVPMIAAVAWRPDLMRKESRLRLSTLHFVMLLVWWVFLYAFLVFPHQYVVLNVPAYDRSYDLLYEFENVLLLAVLAFAAWSSTGAWKKLYAHLLGAAALYAAGSEVLNLAVARGTYYTGSWYDIPLVGSICWMAATALTAREWAFTGTEPQIHETAQPVAQTVAMLGMLSLPVLGLWVVLVDASPLASRIFRLLTVLVAMLLLGACVFLRQYIQDQTLIHLLAQSRESCENQQKLQSHLVQKEKLASLGQIVAGAAHEIDLPVTSILGYSERLWSTEGLSGEQDAMVRKIVHQAQRTRDLVSNLLSFAQRSSGEKVLVDLGQLLQRAAQMLEPRRQSGRIRMEIFIEPEFPRIRGNANQLFQVLVELIENAMDALDDAGGGALQITAQRLGSDAVVQFSDDGPGIREPQRVFDPFYTTKPVGKGTGLGLSVAYGVVQDHGGQITCQNKPTGGALFVVRFPAASETAVQAAGAAHS
jgi:signal transduction histidine kinase